MARDNLLTALEMLLAAGWSVRPSDGVMLDAKGRPVRFEVLLNSALVAADSAPMSKAIEFHCVESAFRSSRAAVTNSSVRRLRKRPRTTRARSVQARREMMMVMAK